MSRPIWALLGLAVLLPCLVLASFLFGSGSVPSDQVIAVLSGGGTGEHRLIVLGMRGSKTLIALVAGAALGIAGVLVQALTRNPIAEPGLLGVNAGAACAVAIGLGIARSLPIALLMLVSLAGALISGLVVTGASGAWRGRHDPVRIVLVGAAWSAVVSAITTFMLLSDPRIYDEFRFWDAGAVMPRPLDLVAAAAALSGLGLLAALLLSRSLDALALGEEFARGLGVSAGRARGLVTATCLVLCAAATALVGPISFLGLIAPFAARLIAGPRHRVLIWLSALLGGVTLLAADVLGRVVNPPAEVQAALMCALLGAPLFIALARARRLVQL